MRGLENWTIFMDVISVLSLNGTGNSFYYEGTSSYIPLKILEPVNRVIFENSSELFLPKIPQQTKTCSKSTTKECFSNFIRVSL